MLRTFLFAIVFSGIAVAQPVGAGLKFGVPFTDAFHQPSDVVLGPLTGSQHFDIGPYVEVRLPLNLSIEADALFRDDGSLGRSWEFPLVAKEHLMHGPVKPFVEGGLAFSKISDIPNFITAKHTGNFGIVLGGGVDIHAAFLHISPEIRYEGWALHNFTGLVDSNRNQFSVLVGVGF